LFWFIFEMAPVLAVMVMEAAASPLSDFDGSALDPKGLAVKQGVGRFAVGGFENPAEGRAGNRHPFGRVFLVKALEIGQAEGFELIQGHDDLFELAARHAGGLENRGRGAAGDAAAAKWPGHVRFLSLAL
jgi:hypothetical protein